MTRDEAGHENECCGHLAESPTREDVLPARARLNEWYAAAMTGVDVRWRQRLENFSRAVSLLRSALANGPDVLNDLEREGVVQRFEYTVELAWKVLKDFLEHSGAQLLSVTPKSVVKAAFAARLVPDGQLWVDMLDHRNMLSHQYDPALLGTGLVDIQSRYLPALEALRQYLEGQST